MSDDLFGVHRPERAMLTGFLDWYRQVVANKVDGLSLAQASTVMTSTGLSALAVVKHLSWVEAGWFRGLFAGEPVGRGGSNPNSFRLTPDETIESVVTGYHEECAHSRRITDSAPSLDDLSAQPSDMGGRVSLRWILLHMLEETARHAGHLDLMRETLDGRTGD